MPSSRGRLNDTSFWMLTALCAVLPLLLGGVPDWTVWCAAIPLGLLTLSQSTRSTLRVSRWLFVPLLLMVYYAIQLIPMPIALLNLLSPQSANWAVDVGLNAAPLSLNPYETQLALGLQFCFIAALFLGRRVSTMQIRYLIGGIACSAALVSLIGWLHILFEWQSVMGFYQTQDFNKPQGFVTSFLNANTCAGFLCLGVAASFGLTLEQGKPLLMRLGLGCTYLCAGGVVMTQSKSGLIALFLIYFSWFYALYLNPKFYRIRAYLPYRRTLLWFLCPSVIIGILILVLMPNPESIDSWSLAFERKLDILKSTQYLEDFWAFGSGRGSFETVFPLYQISQVRGTFSHAENIVFQFLSETGVVMTAVVVIWALALIKNVVTRLEFGNHPLHWSLGLGVLAILAQQFADFGLESVGLVLTFGVIVGRLLRSERDATLRVSNWWLRLYSIVPISILLLNFGLPENPVDKDTMASFQTCGSVEKVVEQTRRISQRVPSDYLVFENALHNLIRCHPDNWKESLAFAQQAQRRAPNRGETRLVTAQLFAHHGYLGQASVEFKASIHLSPWLWNEARVAMQAHLIKAPSLLFAAVGHRPEHRSAMLGFLIGTKQYEVAGSFLEQWLIHGLDLNEYSSRKTIICVRTRNVPCLKSLTIKDGLRNPQRAYIVQAWLAHYNQETEYAAKLLKKTLQGDLSKRLNTADTILARALSIELSDLESARTFVGIQWTRSDSVEKRVQALYASSVLEEQFGDLAAAVRALENIYKLAPNQRFLIRALNLEIKLKNKVGARLKLTKLKQAVPAHPALKKLIKKVRALD
jgi:hypothetical protein